MNEDFEELLNATDLADAKIAMGQKVDAKIVSIGKEYVFLDLGTRSEGMLLKEELVKDGELSVKEGDIISVVTASVKDGAVLCVTKVGQSTVSRTDDKIYLIEQIKNAYESGLAVDGKVTASNKGGFNVDVLGISAFCPISQIELYYCEDPSVHIGKTYGFLVTKIDSNGSNLVLSRKKILEKEAALLETQEWQTIKIGDVRDGVVKTLQPYGAFVDIGGVQGLLHISQMSYERISHPEKVLEQGQNIRVQVIELDSEKKKISLSLKSLLCDPWDDFFNLTSVGSVFEGQVSRIAEFGAFIQLCDGIEGLLHISELKIKEYSGNIRKHLAVGQKIQVRILQMDNESRRVSLSQVDTDAEEEKEALSHFTHKTSSNLSMGTFGDVFLKNKKS